MGWSLPRFQRHQQEHIKQRAKEMLENLEKLINSGKTEYLLVVAEEGIEAEFKKQLSAAMRKKLIPLSAAPASSGVVPMAYSVSRVDVNRSQSITRGATAWIVQRLLGSPRQKLSSDTWVYYGFHADLGTANDQQCDKLILTVVRGEVTDIKLVNDHAAKLIAAHAKTRTAGTIAASK